MAENDIQPDRKNMTPSGNDILDAIFDALPTMSIIGVMALIAQIILKLQPLATIGSFSLTFSAAVVIIVGLLQGRSYLKSIGKA